MGFSRILAFWAVFISGTLSLAAPATIDGLYVNTFGDAKNQALVFVHGGPGYNSYSFEVTAARQLADQGYFVIVYDQRGSGRSAPAKSPANFTYKAYVQDLKRIIDGLKVETPILMGHSFGGSLALSYLQTYPSAVREVILVAAPVSMPQTFRAIVERAARLNLRPTWDIAEYQRKMGNLAQMGQVADAMFGAFPIFGMHANGKRLIPPQVIGTAFSQAMANGTYEVERPTDEQKTIDAALQLETDKKWLGDMKSEPMIGFAQNENYATFDFFDVLAQHRNRIFGIYGAEDGLFDQIQLEQIRKTLPEGHFRLIPQASHAVFQHRRSEFVGNVKSYAKTAAANACTAIFGK